MNLLHDQIAELCHGLKLQRLAADWPGIAQRAAAEEAGYAEFLKRVLSTERDARTERQRQTLLKMATLPSVKTFEQFDCKRPGIYTVQHHQTPKQVST